MPIKPFWGVLLAALLAAIGIAAVFADRAAPAAESPDSPISFYSSDTTSEYDVLKAQQSLARSVLRTPSSTQLEIAQARAILTLDPIQHFYDLQAQGASALASQGYPSHQIQAILAFDGSEEAIYRACASISTHLLILSRDKYPNDTRTLEAKYIFSWSGMPSIRQTDLVALSSNQFFYAEGSGASTVYYAADVGSERLIAHPDVKKLPSGNGRAAGIDLSMQGTSGHTGYHPVCGSITAKFRSQDFRQTNISGTYAHALFPVDFAPTSALSPYSGALSSRFDLSGKFEHMRSDNLVADIV